MMPEGGLGVSVRPYPVFAISPGSQRRRAVGSDASGPGRPSTQGVSFTQRSKCCARPEADRTLPPRRGRSWARVQHADGRIHGTPTVAPALGNMRSLCMYIRIL